MKSVELIAWWADDHCCFKWINYSLSHPTKQWRNNLIIWLHSSKQTQWCLKPCANGLAHGLRQIQHYILQNHTAKSKSCKRNITVLLFWFNWLFKSRKHWFFINSNGKIFHHLYLQFIFLYLLYHYISLYVIDYTCHFIEYHFFMI